MYCRSHADERATRGWSTRRGLLTPLLVLGAPFVALAPVGGQAPPERAVREFARIGSWDGPVSLTAIRDLVVVPGGVAVSQTLEACIRVLGADGSVARTLGRRGDGPGEFQRIDDLGFIDGRLVAVDLAARRQTFFDLDSGNVETLPLPQPPISPPALWIGKAYATADRTAIISGSVPYDELPRLPIVLARSRTEILDTIAWFDQRPMVFRVGAGRVQSGGRHPLYVEEPTSVSPDGRHFVRLIEIDGGIRLEWYEPLTKARRERELKVPRVAVPRMWADSIHTALYNSVGSRGARFTLAELKEVLPMPESVVGVDVIQAVNGLGVWLGTRTFGLPQRTWWYLSPERGGDFSIRIPAPLRIFDQLGDTIWARDIDDFGVNYVVGLELTRH